MHEITVKLFTRAGGRAFGSDPATELRIALFDRPERHVLATGHEAGHIEGLELRFKQGQQFVLHSLILRRHDGQDLFRWAGAGELLRESRGLRVGRADGGVRIECVGEDPAIAMTLDPQNSDSALEVLLSVSSTGALTAASERTPDLIAIAVDQLHAKIDDFEVRSSAAAEERFGRLEAQIAAEAQRVAHGVQQRLDRVHAQMTERAELAESRWAEVAESRHVEVIRTFDVIRAEAEQRNNALIDVFNQRLGEQMQRHDVQLAQARELITAQANHLAALQRSTSWRVTAPLRLVTHLLTGRRSLKSVLYRLKMRRAQAPAPVLREETTAPAATEVRPARPEPQPVAFPQAGAVVTLGELGEAPRTPLPIHVSVVIPTYNAGDELYWLLRKLTTQRGLAGVEVVVVDSGSTDGTPELAEEFGCTVVRITQAEFSHSHARNLGADNATGDLLLFTVQDAYPVGDWWLYSLAKGLLEPQGDGTKLAAVSCAEFPRTDSELLYNAAVDTHYRFLGCRDGDRIGAHTGDDHMSLRAQGQLSDVACMIPADLFRRYRYEGRYAEDLILGVRLLKDGLPIAMLSSVKVIHSHNRAAAYHLKRTFVDVVFLTEVFPDFPIPMAESAAGAAAAAARLDEAVSAWSPMTGVDAALQLRDFASQVRLASVDVSAARPIDFGFAPLSPWLEKAIRQGDGAPEGDAHQLRNMFADRLDHLAHFVDQTYGAVDDHLADALSSSVRKTLAATFGAQLSFLYLKQAGRGTKARKQLVADLRTLMTAGI